MIVKVKNMNVLISKEDLGIFQSFNWHINDTGYVVWRGIINGKKKTIRLHRLIARAGDADIVDHINRNKLDNSRENLRLVDFATNIRNSQRCENAKGYYYSKNKKRWTIDSRPFGIKSLYMDTEEDCINYLADLRAGKIPKRVFTKRLNISGRKITNDQIEFIFSQYELGVTRRAIADQLGYSASSIGRVISGKTYKELNLKERKKSSAGNRS